MPNALIYSPGFDGHRQIYVFVIAHILKELQFNIYIAGNTKQILSNSFYIDKLKENPEITVIDTSNYTKGGLDITPIEFLQLQNSCQTDLTVFTEADNHLSLFNFRIFKKRNRFRGKIVAIFMRPFFYYNHIGIFEKLRYLKNLPLNWKNDEYLFYNFFLNHFSPVNVALSIDENFVNHFSNFNWLPDVFQQYAELIVKDEKSEERVWIEKLDEFKKRNKENFYFFYFGTAQYRRGYDILLKLAVENDGCFIHCGLRDNSGQFFYDTNQLRLTLSKNGHLFETDQYIADPFCIEYFFKSASHLILPYRNFVGSSGVMLQALAFGIPVLAPESGIIGYRIKKYHLGITYNENDPTSLKLKFDFFKKLNPKKFENNIKAYMNYQDTEQLKKVLVTAFTNSSEIIRHPLLEKP